MDIVNQASGIMIPAILLSANYFQNYAGVMYQGLEGEMKEGKSLRHGRERKEMWEERREK